MSGDDIFGAKKNMDFAEFLPKLREERRVASYETNERLDSIADKHGFISREPIEPLVRVERIRKKTIVQDTVYIRGPLEMTNAFKAFCNRAGMNYGEALEYLLKHAKEWPS